MALLLTCLSSGRIAHAQDSVQEHVTVGRVEVTLHATDRYGEPIRYLTTGDFRVLVDGSPVPIESLEWFEPIAPTAGESAVGPTEPTQETSSSDLRGRWLVLLFQWEIQGQKNEGFMRMKRQALEFAGKLGPDDRVAVLSYGSRLWLRQDFTTDRAKVRRAIENALVGSEPDRSSDTSTLGAVLTADATAASTSIERALFEIGRALRPLPGSKAILFFGWGVGSWDSLGRDYTMGSVRYSAAFERAQRALQEAQAPVFVLDISAGHHQLQEALERLSFDTGGYYLETWQFPRWAMGTVARTIGGHYVLVFRPPGGRHGVHDIKIETRRSMVLLFRQTYED